MLAFVLLATLSAEPIKVAAPGLKLVNVDPQLQEFYTGHLAQQLSFHGVRTITAAEIAALLGLERQRQLLGCADDACKAEVSSALGVDGLMVGTVTKLERTYQLDVRVIAVGDGRALAGATASSDDNDRLVGTFVLVAEQLARQLSERLGRPLSANSGVELVQGASRVKRLSWVPAAVGLAAVAAGTVLLVQAKGQHDLLTKPQNQPLTEEQYERAVSTGKTQQALGWAGVGLGLAGVAAGAGMFFFGGDEVIRAGVALAPGGASLSFAGAF